MTLLVVYPIEKPKIDIRSISLDYSIAPRNRVEIFSPDDFEQFITEWLYGCKQNEYEQVIRLGASGDKGRDVVAHALDGGVDYYQCKHYTSSLAPSNYWLEFGKLCYYTFMNEYPIPTNYYIIASNGLGNDLQELVDNPKNINNKLVENWVTYCEGKIIKRKPTKLEGIFKVYVEKFDFSIVKTYSIDRVIHEHLNTKYGVFRFGGIYIERPVVLSVPTQIENQELDYIRALFEAYSDYLKCIVSEESHIKDNLLCYKDFNLQRKRYFSAESIKRFVRDTFTSVDEFAVLEDEVFAGVIDTIDDIYSNGLDCLKAVMRQVTSINTSKCILDSKLNYIGNTERQGVCHMLVNDGKIKWVKQS